MASEPGGLIVRFFRLLGTAFGFAIFGLGALFLSQILYVVLHLVIRDQERRVRCFRKAIGLSFKTFVFLMHVLRVFDVHIKDFDRLKHDRGCLWLCNHPSLVDYVIICSVIPEVTCMVKGSLWHNFFMGATIRAAQYIPNDQEDHLLRECQKRLERGENILIFPEGTRTQVSSLAPTAVGADAAPGTAGTAAQAGAADNSEAEPLRLKRGAANIALRCHADVRLFHIKQEPRFLTKEHKWYYVPHTVPQYEVSVGEYLKYEDFACSDPELMPRAVRSLTTLFARKLAHPAQEQAALAPLAKARAAANQSDPQV